MRALFWLLGLFAIAAGLTAAAHYNEGYVLVVSNPWRIQLSLNLFAVLFVAAFVLVYLVVRLIANMLAMPARAAEYRRRKQRDRAAGLLFEALRLQFEGRYGQALKQAQHAYDGAAAPGLAALLAARAAEALRDPERCHFWLGRAAEHDREVRNARLMTEAEIATHARRFDQAHDRLESLRLNGQRHIAALRLSLRVAQAQGKWGEVVRIARQLQKHRALTADEFAPMVRRAHLENLRAHEGDAPALVRYWTQLPDAERADRRVAATAARALIAADDSIAAQKLLEGWLDTQWDSELAELYGECRGGEFPARILRAEKWLLEQPQDARLLLTLGRLCNQHELWGKAQSYFEASLSREPMRAAHLELALLHERLGREAQAQAQFRAAALA